jgi:hypothetical protein
MKKSTYLIVNVLTRIFSDSPQNTLSDAAKFVRGLRCPENCLLNVLSAALREKKSVPFKGSFCRNGLQRVGQIWV